MKYAHNTFYVILMLAIVMLSSCLSDDAAPVVEETVQVEPEIVEEPVVVQEEPALEIVEETPEIEEPVVEEPVVSEEDLEYARSVGGLEGEISYDLFQADKNEILSIIEKLGESMQNRDYQLWRSYLTPSSISYWSNRMNLHLLSAKLPGDDVVLRDLSSYFIHMFIPSRIGRQVTEIRYDSTTAVKAVQVDGNRDIIYYDFVKEDGKWLVQLQRL